MTDLPCDLVCTEGQRVVREHLGVVPINVAAGAREIQHALGHGAGAPVGVRCVDVAKNGKVSLQVESALSFALDVYYKQTVDRIGLC